MNFKISLFSFKFVKKLSDASHTNPSSSNVRCFGIRRTDHLGGRTLRAGKTLPRPRRSGCRTVQACFHRSDGQVWFFRFLPIRRRLQVRPPQCMETVVISDTSCLIILDKIGQLPLLKVAYSQVFVTATVAAEFGQALPEWVVVKSPENSALTHLLEETIDPGEASSIALAVEIKDCYLILDDLRARSVARSMGLHFTGTLGFIASAKKRGLVPAARPLFEQMLATDFRISKELIAGILEELGE